MGLNFTMSCWIKIFSNIVVRVQLSQVFSQHVSPVMYYNKCVSDIKKKMDLTNIVCLYT